jgi:alkylation response protein AidB-like acyl-CoA dehydrogenase
MNFSEKIGKLLLDYNNNNRGKKQLFVLPPKIKEMQNFVREWAQKEAKPFVARMDQQKHSDFDWELVRRGAKAGLLTRIIPGIFGGDGGVFDFFRFGTLGAAVFCEELSAVCSGMATLFGAHYLGIMPILVAMDFRLARRLLKPICEAAKTENPKLCAFAITEPGAGSDAEDNEGGKKAHLGTFAEKVKGGYILNGRKQFISNGSVASLITVFACTDRKKGIDAWTCFAVTPDMKGFSIGRIENKMGQRASHAAELIFEELFVPEENRVGLEGDGWLLNQLTLDSSRGPVGAIALGGARHAIEVCIEYFKNKGLIKDRYIELELADMLQKYEAARSLVWRSCGTFPPLHYLSAMAKCVASDTAMEICSKVIDLMGVDGVKQKNEVEKIFRDIKLTQIYEGTNQINRLAVAEELLVNDNYKKIF